jgi:deoxycytidylate deaminase
MNGSRKKFFELAKKLSEKSTYWHKLGAVVVTRKGRIAGVGFNKPTKTHPKSGNEYKTIHAEFDAIIGLARSELAGATVYVYRQYKDGSPALSKPCACCEAMLREVGIKNVYYTSSNGYDVLEF